MTDFILGGGFSFWSRECDFPTYFQRGTTTHKIVLVRAQMIATHVGLNNLEVCIDYLVADKTVLRAQLPGRCQLPRGADGRKRYTMNRRSR